MKKKILLLSVVLFILFPSRVYASPIINGIDYSPIFQYNIYLEKNPDVKKALSGALTGNAAVDEALVFQHFMTQGMTDGRCASNNFDVKSYVWQNADLRAAFGVSSFIPYYTHYLLAGQYEKRNTLGNTVSPSPTADGKEPDSIVMGGEPRYHIQTTGNGVPVYGTKPWPAYILSSLDAAGVTPKDKPIDKLKKIATYVSGTTVYDQKAVSNPKKYVSSYTTYGALVNHRAVCQGMAQACQALAQACGIETYPETGKDPTGLAHSWSISIIDGVEYWYDPTNFHFLNALGMPFTDMKTMMDLGYVPENRWHWIWTLGKTQKRCNEDPAAYVYDKI